MFSQSPPRALNLAYNAESRALIAETALTGGYSDVDADTLSEGLNFLVQGAWYWDNLNLGGVRSDAMRKTALVLFHHAFPRHFVLAAD